MIEPTRIVHAYPGLSRARQVRSNRGFTLIELMITVVIVVILAAVAYPGYQNSVRKGHRGDAQAYLMDVAQREQQYFTDNRAYVTDPNTLGDPVPGSVSPYYSIAITVPANATPPTFSITATPIGSQSPDGALTIDHRGAKTPSNVW